LITDQCIVSIGGKPTLDDGNATMTTKDNGNDDEEEDDDDGNDNGKAVLGRAAVRALNPFAVPPKWRLLPSLTVQLMMVTCDILCCL
jgi:hypothetical protein